MIIRFLAAFLAAFLLAFSAHAQAPPCDVRAKVLSSLEKNYTEIPIWLGLTSGGVMIEVLTSPEGSWTIILTYANGFSCLVASGKYWENLPKKTTGGGT